MKKNYFFKLLSIALVALVTFASCESDNDCLDDVVVDSDLYESNRLDAESSVGIRSIGVEVPIFSFMEKLITYKEIKISLMSVEDHVEYIIPVKIESFNSDNFDTKSDSTHNAISITSDSELLAELPHQTYYLNHLIYDTDEDGSELMESIGATLSIEDPDDIKFLSTFDTSLEVCVSSSGAINIPSYNSLLLQIYNPLATGSDEYQFEGKVFNQTADIDLEDYFTDEKLTSWTAMGKENASFSDGTAFCGEYNGNGFSIIALNSTYQDALGFFYRLGDGAYIHDLTFYRVSLAGDTYVGTLAAKIDSGAYVTIENVVAEGGYVYGVDCVGGLIGSGAAYFDSCTVSLTVGYNNAAADTEWADRVGGFVGYCDLSNSIYMTYEYGYHVRFDNCEFTGSVDSDCNRSGGFCGAIIGDLDNHITFVSCAVSGSIAGYSNHGGFVGYALWVNIDIYDSAIGSHLSSNDIWVDQTLVMNVLQKDASKRDLNVGGFVGYYSGGLLAFKYTGNNALGYPNCGKYTFINYESSASSGSSTKDVNIGGAVGYAKDATISGEIINSGCISKTGSSASYTATGDEYIGGFFGTLYSVKFPSLILILECANASSSQFACVGLCAGYMHKCNISGTTLYESTGVLSSLAVAGESDDNTGSVTVYYYTK